MVYLSVGLLNLSLFSVGTMNVTGMPLEALDDSDDEFGVLEGMNVGIPKCEGLPRQFWNMKCVTFYNDEGVLVGEGTCHNVNSDLVLGAIGPLGDIHVAVFVAKTHSKEHLPQERVYSLVAWPIQYVHCLRASLQDHEAQDNFSRIQAALLNPPSLTSSRPYTNTIRNPPRETFVKTKDLLTQESINAVSSKTCCSQNCVQSFSRAKIRAFREQMYHNSTFKHRNFMKTEVHRQVIETRVDEGWSQSKRYLYVCKLECIYLVFWNPLSTGIKRI